MASSTVDALVVTLGLDASGFSKGIKGSAEELAGFTRRLAGMFFAIRGIEDVVDYFKDLHRQLADIGFEARNLGIAGTSLSRLGEVAQLFGGQMQDAAQTVEGLQGALFGLKYQGQMSESLMMLQRFGIAYMTASGHMRQTIDIARDAAAVLGRVLPGAANQGERYQVALSMGFTGGIASAVSQGVAGFDAAFKKATGDQKSLTDKTIASQVALERATISARDHMMALNSTVLARLTPTIEKLIEKLRHLADDVIPVLDKKIDAVIAWLNKPHPLVHEVEGKLGTTGTIVAALAALFLGKRAIGAAAGMLGALGVPLVGASAGLGWLIGEDLNAMYPRNPLKEFGGFLGDKLGNWLMGPKIVAGPPAHYQDTHGIIQRGPIAAVPTPGAERPNTESATGAQLPGTTAFVGAGGQNVEIGQITINTRASDANGIAREIGGAIRRNTLAASSDGGVG